MKQLGLAVLTLAFWMAPAFADEPGESGPVKGPGVELLWQDHNLTGRIGGIAISAASLEKEFGMTLVHRAGGREFRTELKKVGKRIGGTVESLDRHGKLVRKSIEITGADAASGKFSGILDGKAFNARVSAKSMNGHHFVAPVFDFQFASSAYQFRMDSGMACMGCAIKMSMVVLSMLSVTGSL